MDADGDVEKFWKEREARTGAPVSFRSYAVFLGRPGEDKMSQSGVLYISGNYIYFENVEGRNFWGSLFGGKASSREHFEFRIPIDEIDHHEIFSFRSRRGCRIVLNTGDEYSFEVLDLKGFLARL